MTYLHFLRLCLLVLLVTSALPAFAQIWSEDFNSYANGTFNAPPKWFTNATDCDDGGINVPGESMWGVYSGQFTVNDIEGFPCCSGGIEGGGNDNSWQSEVISLAGYCNVGISMVVGAVGVFECNSPGIPIFDCSGMTPPDNSHDQVVVEYSLDGGAFIEFGYVCGASGAGVLSVGGLNGATLQLRFYAACKSNGETYTIDNIVVTGSQGGTPTFAPIGPLCETDPPVVLPTTSLEGITGTWNVGTTFNPAGLGGTTASIIFTPDPSFCAINATVNIVVEDQVLPNPDPLAALCSTDPPVPLPTNVDGITGNWSGPGVSGNQFDPGQSGSTTLTFTPDPGQCASNAILPVTVNQTNSPTLGAATICHEDPPFDLTQLEDPLYPGGTWAGPNVTGNIFNPTGLLGTVFFTYTPINLCTNSATTTITILPHEFPILTPTTVCETGGLVDLIPLQDPLYSSGTWSGPGVVGTNFNPSGLPGSNTVTFTSNESCVAPATTTVTVEVPGVPTLGTATLCANDPLFDLTTLEDPLYPGGTWVGPNVVGTNEFDPNGLFGPITLTYLPSQSCVLPGTTDITVQLPGTPDLGTVTICQSDPPFDLSFIQDPLFPDGFWTGPNVTGSFFDPTGLSGAVPLIFTPTTSCAFASATFVTVEIATTPNLGTATLCETSGLFDLTTIQDPNMPNGTWAGDGVTGTVFDPFGLMGTVLLTFTPTGSCSVFGGTTITVNPSGTPNLGTDTLCQTAGIFNLNNIADPLFPAGVWTGDGVTGTNFDPTAANGVVPLTFTPAANCSSAANTTITVNVPVQPAVGTASICQNTGPFDLNNIADPAYPTGTWSGPNVTGNTFDPANQTGAVPIVFTSNANCTLPDTTNVQVFAAPTFSNLTTTCDPATQLFTVSFDIAGGSGPVYSVGGSPLPGNSFVSTPQTSGPFSFSINDNLGCGPTLVNGSANCACATSAGNMDFGNAPLLLCQNAPINVMHQGNQNLDTDDILLFVLHTNAGTSLGNVLATSNTTSIANPGGLTLGQTYYVSAVAGNNNGNGSVDLDDPCLSVAQGIPVSFYLPTALVNPPAATICLGECFEFTAQLGGQAPFLVDFTISTIGSLIGEAIDGVGPSFTYNFCPPTMGVFTFSINGIIDANDCLVSPSSSNFTTLTVVAPPLLDLQETLCPGGSIAVNGTLYNETNPSGTEIIIGGATNGCDSMVNIALSFFPPDTNFIEQTFCPGGSLTVNGTLYNQSNPDGIEVVQAGDQYGCDSVISVNLTFSNTVIGNLTPTLCPGGSINVNGTIYNAANPSGSQTFPGGSVLGCDSTVLINLSFFPPAVANISPQVCTGGSITINGEIFDENNPSGIQTMMDAAANGCDSVININVIFTDGVVFNLTPVICENDSVIVNGTVYDFSNPTGSEVFPNGSVLGCDSTVNVALGFLPIPITLLEEQLCTGGSIDVNGTTYNENNPFGFELVENGATNGCDSIIVVDLTFSNVVTGLFNPTLCHGATITINGIEYDEANPSGSFTIPDGSQLGCDSVTIIDLGFWPENTFNLTSTLCAGEVVLVNGTPYNSQNPSGTEILIEADVNGCDSTVIVDLDFFQENTVTLEPQICIGGSITINGTVYDENNPSGMAVLQNADVNGCDSTVFVNAQFTDNVVFQIMETICAGDSIVINGETYNQANPTGSVTFPMGSVLGCDSTVTVSVNFFPPANSFITETLQQGGSIIVNGTVYDQSNPTGTEILPGASANGCDSIIQIILLFENSAIVVDYEVNPTSCALGNDGSIEITSITGGLPPYTIALNGGNSDVVAVFPYFFDNLENGFYSLSVLDDAGKFISIEIFLPFPDPPVFDLGPDITIDLGQQVVLSPALDFTPSNYVWSPENFLDCTDCPTPTSTPFDDITYFLTVTDENGCTFTDNVSLFVQKARNVFGPSAFSPNNDARNDEFTLFAGQQVAKINSLLIFDRWGALMFEQYNFEPNNLSIGWDGRHKGQMMNPGLYAWFAEVEFLDGHVGLYEGEVSLIR